MSRLTKAAICFYAFAAIATFGHSSVRIYDRFATRCASNQSPVCFPEEPAIVGGILSGMAWPLYWSVQIARSKP